MAQITRIVVAAEREVVPGLQPAVIGAAEFVERSKFDHGIFLCGFSWPGSPVIAQAAPNCLRGSWSLDFSVVRIPMTFWICASKCVRNRNHRNTLFLILRLRGRANGKTSGFRGAGDLRKSRGITVICGSRRRAGAVQGHGVEGGHPARGAARPGAVQPPFPAPFPYP